MATVDDFALPAITFSEEASPPADPPAGAQRFYIDGNGDAWLVDSTGAARPVAPFGDLSGAADGDSLVFDDTTGLWVPGTGGGGGGGGTWSAFTPTWTAGSGTPAVGSTGSLTGSYTQTGKLVQFRICLLLGGAGISTGSGNWFFALPVAHVAPPAGIANHGVQIGGYFEDLGTRAYAPAGARLKASSTTLIEVLYGQDGSSPGSASVMGATAPFTWGSGDYLSMYGMYEAA